MSKTYPSADQLREHFSYDPETGIFTRRTGTPKYPVGSKAGCLGSYGYWLLSFKKERYLAHRVAFLMMTGELPPADIDHINGDRLDNRWANLRAVTRGENLQNLRGPRKNNRAGLLGVHQVNGPNGKWRARVNFKGRTYEAGCHATPEIAHQAYLEKKRSVHAFCTI